MEHDDKPLEVWKIGRDLYQARLGIKRPHIGEISGVQYGLMSKRAKKAYDAKRHAEWEASGACATQYAKEVFEAFLDDPGILEHPELHREARTAIISAKIRFAEADKEARLEALRDDNRIETAEEVRAGDRLWWLLGGRYLKVTKVLKISLRGIDEDAGTEHLAKIGACIWLKSNDLNEAAEAGKTSVRPRPRPPG